MLLVEQFLASLSSDHVVACARADRPIIGILPREREVENRNSIEGGRRVASYSLSALNRLKDASAALAGLFMKKKYPFIKGWTYYLADFLKAVGQTFAETRRVEATNMVARIFFRSWEGVPRRGGSPFSKAGLRRASRLRPA